MTTRLVRSRIRLRRGRRSSAGDFICSESITVITCSRESIFEAAPQSTTRRLERNRPGCSVVLLELMQARTLALQSVAYPLTRVVLTGSSYSRFDKRRVLSHNSIMSQLNNDAVLNALRQIKDPDL